MEAGWSGSPALHEHSPSYAALESRGVCLGCLTRHTGPSITESGYMGSKCLLCTVVAFISAGSRFKESLMNISRK